jgi:SdpC family antimicrobial peptide
MLDKIRMPSRVPRLRPPRRVAMVVALAIAATAGFVALSSGAGAAPDAVAVQPSVAESSDDGPERFDGASLMRGLYFGLGPVAQEYSQLVMVQVEGEEHAPTVDLLLADVEQLEPGFFDRYAAAMYSGNQVEIQYANEDAARLLHTAATARYPDMETTEVGDGRGMCINIALVVNAAVVVNAAAAVNIFAAWAVSIYRHVQFWAASPREPESQPGGLTYERWVDEVAATLSTG